MVKVRKRKVAGDGMTILDNKNKKKGKRFYPVRVFRLSEENYQWLKKQKKGTWNFTISNLKKLCARYDKIPD